MDAELEARIRAVKKGLRIVPNATVVRLPKVTRGMALKGQMNARMTEVAAVSFPRSANQRAAGKRSSVTAIVSK